jgi:hypothetical protein
LRLSRKSEKVLDIERREDNPSQNHVREADELEVVGGWLFVSSVAANRRQLTTNN